MPIFDYAYNTKQDARVGHKLGKNSFTYFFENINKKLKAYFSKKPAKKSLDSLAEKLNLNWSHSPALHCLNGQNSNTIFSQGRQKIFWRVS